MRHKSLLLCTVCTLLLSGCGGGGSTSASTGSTPAPAAQVVGVQTPSSVSVVTPQQ